RADVIVHDLEDLGRVLRDLHAADIEGHDEHADGDTVGDIDDDDTSIGDPASLHALHAVHRARAGDGAAAGRGIVGQLAAARSPAVTARAEGWNGTVALGEALHI